MMQTYSQLLANCEQYNSLFIENEMCILQKAYSTPHFLTLSVRLPGKTVVLYIGRGNQYQGLYLAEKMPPTHLRIQDRLLDYVRRHLVGARLTRITCEENKMLFSFRYKAEGELKSFYFGWHERQLHFGEGLPEKQIGFSISTVTESTRIWTLEDYYKSKDLEASKKVAVKKKEKFLLKKIINIQNDIEKNSTWRKIEASLNSDEIDFSDNEVVVCGEKIKFKNCKNDWQKKDLVFKKIKKLKRGEELLKTRLEACQNELLEAQKGNIEFLVTKEPAIQPYWPNQKSLKSKGESKNNIRHFKIGAVDGVVGLDSTANDEIRKSENKEFFWFHLENYKGAHCVLKTENVNQFSQIELSGLASMLRDLSHLEILTIPILFTQIKNVKGVKGSQGKVIVNKAKHLQCQYIPWKETIIM